MFASHGPCRFEIKTSGIAKLTPATRMAGQISSMPPQPAKAQISQKGTRMQNGPRMRPTMAPRRVSL